MTIRDDWFIQWSYSLMKWECVACRGISYGRDYESVTHLIDPGGKIAELRARASSPEQQRMNGINPLYHRADCSQLITIE